MDKRIFVIRHLPDKVREAENPEDDKYYIDEEGEKNCDETAKRLMSHGVDHQKAVILYAEVFPRASLSGVMLSEKTGIPTIVMDRECDFYDKKIGEKGCLTLAEKVVTKHH